MSHSLAHEKSFLDVLSAVLIPSGGTATFETALMRGDEPIDSVTLVEVCIRLEDHASSLGFDFDWVSENAMSQSRSIFQTVGTLFEEFNRQLSKQTL